MTARAYVFSVSAQDGILTGLGLGPIMAGDVIGALGYVPAKAAPPAVGIPAGGTTGQALEKNSNADYDVSWQTVVGMAIGNPVGSGTAGVVLFVDGSGNLGQSAGLTWNETAQQFAAASTTTSAAVLVSNTHGTTVSAQLCSSTLAGFFTDGTRQAFLCDGTYTFNVTVGSIITPGTSGNTYQWGANASAPATQALLSLPLNTFGAGTITSILGTPDNWVLININGTDYKVPCYLP